MKLLSMMLFASVIPFRAAVLSAQEVAIDDRVRQLTLEEKASLVTGQNAWQTREIARLGIPPAWMADGPVGLRKSTGQEVSDSLPATCFPSSAAMAATWKLAVGPGETQRFTIHVDAERLAYFHDGHGRWVIEPGRYEILVGASAADIRATLPLELTAGTLPPAVYSMDDVIGDIASDPRGLAVVDFLLAAAGRRPLSGAADDDFFAAILRNMPFKKLAGFSEGKLTPEQLEQLLRLVNSGMDPARVSGLLQQQAAAAKE